MSYTKDPASLNEIEKREKDESDHLSQIIEGIISLEEEIRSSTPAASGINHHANRGSIEPDLDQKRKISNKATELDRDPLDIMKFDGPEEAPKKCEKVCYYPRRRTLVFGENERYVEGKGWRYTRVVTTEDQAFKDLIETKMRHLNHWIKQAGAEIDPDLLEKDSPYFQNEHSLPTPIEVLRATLQLWKGEKIKCAKEMIQIFLSPTCNICTKDRIICPYCMVSEPIKNSLMGHFMERHWLNAKSCLCGVTLSGDKEYKIHLHTCSLWLQPIYQINGWERYANI